METRNMRLHSIDSEISGKNMPIANLLPISTNTHNRLKTEFTNTKSNQVVFQWQHDSQIIVILEDHSYRVSRKIYCVTMHFHENPRLLIWT